MLLRKRKDVLRKSLALGWGSLNKKNAPKGECFSYLFLVKYKNIVMSVHKGAKTKIGKFSSQYISEQTT